MPGMVRIGELISSIMDLISFSISSISVSNSRMSLMVCFNSRAFAGIFEPMEFLADSRKVMAASLPYLPLELSQSRLVSLVRCADAIARAEGNSDNRAYTDAI